MESQITREAAWELLRKYNKDSFHLQHALTVEGVMRWYAEQLGFADEVDFWGMVGLLHDIESAKRRRAYHRFQDFRMSSICMKGSNLTRARRSALD